MPAYAVLFLEPQFQATLRGYLQLQVGAGGWAELPAVSR